VITRVKISSRPVELFGLAEADILAGSRAAFHQRHDVDAAGFQHGGFGEVDHVQLEPIELVGDQARRTGHEARADAKRLGAQAQVEAGGLDLVQVELPLGDQPSTGEKRRDRAVRQNSCFASHHVSLTVSRRQNQMRAIDASGARRYANLIPW
jgi:hypothetical protein